MPRRMDVVVPNDVLMAMVESLIDSPPNVKNIQISNFNYKKSKKDEVIEFRDEEISSKSVRTSSLAFSDDISSMSSKVVSKANNREVNQISNQLVLIESNSSVAAKSSTSSKITFGSAMKPPIS